MKCIQLALVLGLCLLALGCPKRLPQQHGAGLVPLNGAADASGAQEAGVLEGTAEVLADGSAVNAAGANQPSGFVGPMQNYPGPASAQASAPPSAAGASPGAEAGAPADPGASGAAPAEPSLLDPDAPSGGIVNGPPGYDAEQRGLSDVSLAGTWQVISATASGKSRPFIPGEWELRLEQDGSARITRTDGGQQRKQTGSWQSGAGRVMFNLGPGGQPSYTISGDDADIKVFVDEDGQVALFVVRLAPGTAVPQLYQRYDTDFGALTFAQSGQGTWTGSYGDPAGRLAVRMSGPFCVGTWEQGVSRGGVILRLSHTGFTGWWWYDGAVAFDGSWNGTTGK